MIYLKAVPVVPAETCAAIMRTHPENTSLIEQAAQQVFGCKRRARSCLVAILAALLAVAVRPLFDPALGPQLTFIFSFPAIVVAGWYGGLGPAALATLLCVGGNLALAALTGTVWFTAEAFGRAGIFLLSAALIGGLAEQLHRARAALEGRLRGAEEQARELQHVSAQLARSQQELLLFLDNNPALVWLKDADLRYVYVNESASRSFAIPAACWKGRTDVELFGADVGNRMRAIDERVLRENCVLHEQKTSTANEKLHYVVHRFPVPLLDGAMGVGAIAIDVTREKEIEKQLLEADRRKDAFIATLAHELRNPLAPLSNAARLLANRPDDKVIEWATGVIDRQVAQMAHLLEDLLDVSRITHNRLELRRTRVTLRDVLETACEQARPLLDRACQELRLELPAAPVYLDGDKTRLAQVFANLLNNAARYSQAAGTVTVSAHATEGAVEVRVKDTGIGIDPAALTSIFDEFFQLHPSDKRGNGLGLGLPLVRGLVELHGGSVAAYSEGPGKGCEFVVRLPTVTEPREAATGDTGSSYATATSAVRGLRVLVVDDNHDNADSMGVLLETLGHNARIAYRAEDALTLGATFRPQVVLLDIGLPGMTGYECAPLIRKAEWGRDVLLVAMTGWGKAEDKQRAFAVGFNEHLTKPVDLARLEKMLASYTDAAA